MISPDIDAVRAAAERIRGFVRRTPLRRATLARTALLYAQRFGLPDGRIPATFEILFLTGWAPEALNAEYGTGAATGRPTR